jgi:hypothetical protein
MKRRGFMKWCGAVAATLALDPLLGGEAVWGQSEAKPKELRVALVSPSKESADRFVEQWQEHMKHAGPWRYPVFEDLTVVDDRITLDGADLAARLLKPPSRSVFYVDVSKPNLVEELKKVTYEPDNIKMWKPKA